MMTSDKDVLSHALMANHRYFFPTLLDLVFSETF
jgi:hypothetical protein